MQIFWIVAGCLFAFANFASASSGTEGADFLNIPIGGAPSAMGSAYSALATDAYAPVINPGGLGFVQSPQLAGHHISYLGTSHYDFASFVYPMAPTRSLGVSVQYLGSGDIAGRNESGDLTGDYSAHYGAFSFAFGQAVTEKLSLGISSRWINAKIDDVSANAYAADVGALLKMTPTTQGSFVVSNAGNRLSFLNDSDPLPLTVKSGLATQLPHHWTMSAEGVYHTTGLLSGHFGTEWHALPNIALRAGYRTDTIKELSALAGFSTGVGLFLWGSEFSYSWLPYDDLGQTHSFALVLSFGKAAKSRNLIQYNAYHRPHGSDAMSPSPEDLDNLSSLLEHDPRPLTAQKTGARP